MMSFEYPKQHLYRRILLAKMYIEEHFAERIDLENIAGEASFSKFHFIRLFKKAYGKTPHQYLTRVRVQKAKLLLETSMTVAGVCHAVGFEELSSFTHLFKKVAGLTPSEYQRQRKLRQSGISHEPFRFIPACFASMKGWTEPQFSTNRKSRSASYLQH